MKHGPVPIDDYIGNAIEEGENFAPKQAAMVKEALNLAARYGMNHLPKRAYYLAAKLMLFYHMKMEDAVALYNRYVGELWAVISFCAFSFCCHKNHPFSGRPSDVQHLREAPTVR